MPTRKEASKIRTEYILQRESLRKTKLSLQQEKLYNEIVNDFLNKYTDMFGRGEKEVTSSQYNNALGDLERRLKKFGLNNHPDTLREYIEDARAIGQFNMMYFATLYDDHHKLDEIRLKAEEVTNRQLGVNADGTLKTNGFLNKMGTSQVINRAVLKEARIAFTNGYDIQTFRERMKVLIVGTPKQNGIIERHYNTFAKNVLNSINGSNNNIFRKELGLKYGYYAGGLIKTSRPFCVDKNGKIFSEEQIANFRNDPFIQKMYEGRMDEYDPFVLPGGEGCLHNIDWVTNELAVGHIREQNKIAAERNDKFKTKHNL